jgi:chaperone required for assembly of F1-ATPase
VDAEEVKRFYKAAAAVAAPDCGWRIDLDGRPVRTPARTSLAVPSQALARGIEAEWNAQGEKIDPRSMPMTGLANAAIDRVAPDPQAFGAVLARYAEADLLCYRAERPSTLVARQRAHWDPLLGWARRRFDIDFEIVAGIMHRPQPASTVERLERAIHARSPFELAALSPLVTISGSLVIALALVEEAIDFDAAWSAATVDEAFQAENWGEDAEAAATLEARRLEMQAADGFNRLLREG